MIETGIDSHPSTWTPDAGLSPLIRRIRGEFLEMPGLKLTVRQAARLFGLDRTTIERVLDSLVVTGFLLKSEQGAYLRSSIP